jgi:hypothetical protein
MPQPFPQFRRSFLALLVLAAATPFLLAADPAPIRHSFFVAGPSLTGIIGEDGKVVWDSGRPGARDGFILPNGHALIAWATDVVEFDKERKPIFSYKLSPENKEIGTAQRLENGRTLITELGLKPRLLEVDPTGKIALQVPLKPQTDNAHMQTRMARILANGNYLVPHLLAFSVKEYDATGRIINIITTDRPSLGGTKEENWPFTAIRLESGNTLIACTHGNKVIEVDARGQIVWKITNADLAASTIQDACGAQRLPNGNTVIASYAAQKGIKLFEVTSDKKIVWSYDGGHRVHHFQILTTDGKPLPQPPLK